MPFAFPYCLLKIIIDMFLFLHLLPVTAHLVLQPTSELGLVESFNESVWSTRSICLTSTRFVLSFKSVGASGQVIWSCLARLLEVSKAFKIGTSFRGWPEEYLSAIVD